MTTHRYIVGTDDGQFYLEPYGDDLPQVFTSAERARGVTSDLNETGWIPGPGRTLVKGNPWKVYELVEVTDDGQSQDLPAP